MSSWCATIVFCGWFLAAALSGAGAAEPADGVLRLPVGIDGAPEHGNARTWQVAAELGLRLKTFETRWIEPEPGRYVWMQSGENDTFLEELRDLRAKGYVVSVAYTNVFTAAAGTDHVLLVLKRR